jgi:hypothetical protein
MGDNSSLSQKFQKIPLPAGPSIEIYVIIIGIVGPLNPTLNYSSIRKSEFNLCSVSSGIKIDEISQPFCPE